MKKLFNILPLFCLAAMFTVGCKKDAKPVAVVPDEPKPVVSFTFERSADTTEKSWYSQIQFTSDFKNAKDVLWQFGDDSTSTDPNPMHKYVYDGDYQVLLTVRNSQGYSAAQEILLPVHDPKFDPTKIGEDYFITVGGVFTVSRDNGGGPTANEGSLKVVDGDPNSKFFQSGFAGDLVMKFQLNTPVLAGGYTMVSGNDSPDRDPKGWVLQGSEDGIKWITLDSKSSETFAGRNQRKIYHFDNNVLYTYFRISIKTNNGSRDFQMSEWSVNKKQP